jgi:hypothetical protein
MFDELEILISGQVPDVRCVAGDQIVDGNHPLAFRQQSIAQMRSKKTSGTGYDGNRLRILCGHCALYLMSAAQVYQQEVKGNDEARMTKEFQTLELRTATAQSFVIRISSFLWYSTFVICHFLLFGSCMTANSMFAFRSRR